MLHSILKFMIEIISVSHKEGAMNSGTVSDQKKSQTGGNPDSVRIANFGLNEL